MTGVAPEVGSTANNYQILARLATGGMAEIFLARGTSGTGVERYVVLKRILRDRANDAQLVKMVLDEARLASQLQHPNVAQVYDIGKLGDSYFFTMEYVHGETVRALLHRARSLRRDLPANVILTVIAGAAAGLHHAHERLGHDGRPLGIVHRDVSPSNLMVSYEGGVKVVDFGVAKAENRVQETRSGTVKGKIAYLSPEQCRGNPVDRRSDLFSLGIVFWEMLTIERLYKRNSDFENMTAIVTEDPVLPSSRKPNISPELERICMRMLAKDPNDRYQTADELVEALEEASPRIGAMISSSAVGRLVRDMFGQRPEPWLEMDSTTIEMPQPDPGLTVTSEPVPRELVSGPGASVDLMLAKVRDLSSRMPAETPAVEVDPLRSGIGGIAHSQMLTAQAMPAQRAELNETLRAAGAPTMQGPFVPPPPNYPMRASTGSVPPLDAPVHQDPRSGPQPFPQVQQTFSPTGSSSGEHAYPSASGTSGIHRAFHGSGSSSGSHVYPSGSQAGYPVLKSEPQPQPQGTSRRWALISIVAIAALLGSLTVWFVMRGSGKSTPDAALVAMTPDVAALDPDAAEPSPDITAVTVTPDTAVAVVADAAPAKIEDAAVAKVEDAAVAKVEDAAVKPDAAAPRDPLVVAFEDKRYADVVAECTRSFRAEHASACTLSACKTSQDVRAQKWHGKISNATAKRTIAASCRELGVDVVPKTPPVRPPVKPDAGVDPCSLNPMNCQR